MTSVERRYRGILRNVLVYARIASREAKSAKVDEVLAEMVVHVKAVLAPRRPRRRKPAGAEAGR